MRRLITIEGLPVENAPCAHINRPLYPIQTLQIDIKKDCIVISISIISVNAIKPLRELNITDFLPKSRIHHKTHGLTKGPAVVYIMVTIKIEHIRAIGKNCGNTNQWFLDEHDG